MKKYAEADDRYLQHSERLYDNRLNNKIEKKLEKLEVMDRINKINRLHDYHRLRTKAKLQREDERSEALKEQKEFL